MCFLVLLCTACRLTPIEALPQTPLGTLSLDPAMGFTPCPWTFCSLRSVLVHNSDKLCTFLTPHSSFLIYPCSICHTPLLSSPIFPPKYHQAYQNFPISTSNLLPLLTVYSFWLYRQGKVYPAFVR